MAAIVIQQMTSPVLGEIKIMSQEGIWHDRIWVMSVDRDLMGNPRERVIFHTRCKHKEGQQTWDAVIEACKQRWRAR